MSRRDDERVADILDAAREIGEVIELGRSPRLGRSLRWGPPTLGTEPAHLGSASIEEEEGREQESVTG